MTRNTESLPQLATKIHALERKTIASTIEIGRLLQVAFDRFEHGDRSEYHEWIEKEFAWSERTARRYRELYEFQIGHRVQFEKLNITLTALYYLAELSKADDPYMLPAIEDTIRKAKEGTRITRERATEILSDHYAVQLAGEKIAEAEAKHQAELDDAAADEPDAVGAASEDAPDAAGEDEPTDEPEAPDADEPDDEPPLANELSRALEIIGTHNVYSSLWPSATKLIDAVELQGIIDTLQAVAAQYYGSDALKVKADRAEARSRATQH